MQKSDVVFLRDMDMGVRRNIWNRDRPGGHTESCIGDIWFQQAGRKFQKRKFRRIERRQQKKIVKQATLEWYDEWFDMIETMEFDYDDSWEFETKY